MGGSTGGREEETEEESSEGGTGKRKDRGTEGEEDTVEEESVEWGGLIERDITGDANTTSNRIIATISLMLKTITQKNTGDRLGCELCSLPRGE